MPYKVDGNNVLHKKDGKWAVKQTCKSHEAAIRAMRLLYGIESGEFKPTNQKAKNKIMEVITWGKI